MYYQHSKKNFSVRRKNNRKKILKLFFVFLLFLVAVFFATKIFSLKSTTKVSLKRAVIPKIQQKPKPKPETRLKNPVYFIAVGDIMLSRNVENKIKQNGFNYPFLKTRNYLKEGDIVFGNLECPIIAGREITTGQMMFRAPPGAEKALKSANFSILSLANNHTLNFGKEGILKTFYYLKKTKIKFVGAGENKKEAYNHTIIEKNGTKFAFLAYSNGRLVPSFYEASSKRPGIAFDNKQKMISAVRTANKEADFVIVSMHLGQEYKSTPNSYQKSFARTAIDNGADLVLGHHPHVIQSIEKYKGRYIFYSLGNFIFDQMWSQSTREGLMVKLLFKNNKVTLVEIKPILVENYSQPRILQGGTAKKVLNRIKKNF